MRQTNCHLVVELREYIEGLPKISNVAQIRLQKTAWWFSGQPLPITKQQNWMQVRGVDQTPYPSQLHGASLATAMQRPCRPLLY